MPGCHWHKAVLLWCPSVLDAANLLFWCLAVLEIMICSHDFWLFLTQRFIIIIIIIPSSANKNLLLRWGCNSEGLILWYPAVLWQNNLLLWCLAVIDTQACFDDAWPLLKQRFALMKPSCPWHERFVKGLLWRCLAVLDTRVCTYDTRLYLAQLCAFIFHRLAQFNHTISDNYMLTFCVFHSLAQVCQTNSESNMLTFCVFHSLAPVYHIISDSDKFAFCVFRSLAQAHPITFKNDALTFRVFSSLAQAHRISSDSDILTFRVFHSLAQVHRITFHICGFTLVVVCSAA